MHNLVAIMDLIIAYPDANTAFIGLFMMDSDYQGKCIGSLIINQCGHYLKQCGYNNIRLAIMKGNKQSFNFWIKNNFHLTGEERMTEIGKVCLMERIL